MMGDRHQGPKRILTLISLIIAGEAIFILPFVMARVFRPTLLAVFGITNTELGFFFSIYGIVAVVSYIFGGILADRFAARNLMAIALWLTSVGGMIMFFLPSSGIMKVLYAFWGFTSIFLFWAALIRATREWGGTGFQGRAFGWLEGGRGGTAALTGTIAFVLFSRFSEGTSTAVPDSNGIHAFQIVILVFSSLTFISGLLVWYLVPKTSPDAKKKYTSESIQRVVKVMKLPSVWMLAMIVVCAYVGYKSTDDFSLYAREVLGFSEANAAGVGTAALWIRALVAILAGYLADRYDRIKLIIVWFGVTAVCGFLVGLGQLDQILGIILINLTLTAAGIYGVRAIYFAVMKEAKIPFEFTGTAVGIVSFVGFTPDIFMGPWMGHLLDKYPGEPGHQYVFILLSIFAIIGLITSWIFKGYEKTDRGDCFPRKGR
jgi:MFS family permease